jgi:hypothetical protein
MQIVSYVNVFFLTFILLTISSIPWESNMLNKSSLRLPIMELEQFKELSHYLLHSVRHVLGTRRFVFERIGLPAGRMYNIFVRDMQCGGLYGRLYDRFVRPMKWT